MNSALIASSDGADTILFFQSWLIPVSTEAKNRVPVLIPAHLKAMQQPIHDHQQFHQQQLLVCVSRLGQLLVEQGKVSLHWRKNHLLHFPELLERQLRDRGFSCLPDCVDLL